METMTKYKVKEVTWSEKSFIVKRDRKNFDDLPDFFKETYAAIYDGLKEKKIKSKEPPCAIYYSVDEDKKETDVAAAVPVKSAEVEVEGFENVTIPKAKALQLQYKGGFDKMEEAYETLEKYTEEHELETKWKVEEYLTDPAKEKDQRKWKTNIYYILE